MSASQISLSATPNSAKRRSVTVKEKKSKSKSTIADNGFHGADSAGVGGGGGRGGGNVDAKDLNLTFEEDLALERSRKLNEIKQTLAAATSTPPTKRARKVVAAKQENSQPRWLNLVSVFVKNVLPIVLVLGLGQMLYTFCLKDSDRIAGTGTGSMDLFDFDRRIVEAESLLKSATKTMQAKVDGVDKKIEDEIGGLRRDLRDKIEENAETFKEEIGKIEGRTEGLESLLSELVDTGLMKKDEFHKFYNEFKNDRTTGHGDMSLDEIRASLREMIDKEFERHGADGLGRVDYAVATGGAVVVKHSEPYNIQFRSRLYKIWHRRGVSDFAEKMLTPSFGEPGQCLPLKGSSGFVQIRLRTAIVPEAVTLEHVSKSVAFDVTSAPKDCRVSGWLESRGTKLGVKEEKMFLLTEFTYDPDKSSAQTFNVLDSASPALVNMIRFDFVTNHGNPSHTCIYRLRVHGHEPSAVSLLEAQS